MTSEEFEKLDQEYERLVKALDENIMARRNLCKKMNDLKKRNEMPVVSEESGDDSDMPGVQGEVLHGVHST